MNQNEPLSLEEQLTAANAKAASIQADLDKASAQVDDLTKQVATLTGERDSAQAEAEASKVSLEQSVAKVEALEKEAVSVSVKAQQMLASMGTPAPEASGSDGPDAPTDVVAGLRACKTDAEKAAYFAAHKSALAGKIRAAEYWGLGAIRQG